MYRSAVNMSPARISPSPRLLPPPACQPSSSSKASANSPPWACCAANRPGASSRRTPGHPQRTGPRGHGRRARAPPQPARAVPERADLLSTTGAVKPQVDRLPSVEAANLRVTELVCSARSEVGQVDTGLGDTDGITYAGQAALKSLPAGRGGARDLPTGGHGAPRAAPDRHRPAARRDPGAHDGDRRRRPAAGRPVGRRTDRAPARPRPRRC
jgi:hypothetical protein